MREKNLRILEKKSKGTGVDVDETNVETIEVANMQDIEKIFEREDIQAKVANVLNL
jgi:hypothetical protein